MCFIEEIARGEMVRRAFPPPPRESSTVPHPRASGRPYFVALAADEERLNALRLALTEADLSVAIDRAMLRAFGDKLRTVVEEEDFENVASWLDFQSSHIRSFLEEVAITETASPPVLRVPRRIVPAG